MVLDRFDEMDLEYSANVADRALRTMSQQSVPATPDNFSVWFAYTLGTPPMLRKTIDVMLSNRQKFDASIDRELFNTFIGTPTGSPDVGSAAEQLNGAVSGARNFLQAAIADNKTQIADLSKASVECKSATDPRPIILRLVGELAKATSRATALEANFASTSEQLEKVRVSLHEAEERSNTDSLTGLANRRSLENFFRSALIGAMETGGALSVFMIDIDHFKKFNDSHGHQIGDQVLKLVSNVLQSSVRESDLAARYGGEELITVLPGVNLYAAKELAERIRKRISDARLKKRVSGAEIGNVTVSIGVAQYRLGESSEEMVVRCDKGLYQAKRMGRNQTVSEDEIIEHDVA